MGVAETIIGVLSIALALIGIEMGRQTNKLLKRIKAKLEKK